MYLALFVVLFMARAASLDLVCGIHHNCVFERGQEAMKCWGNNGDGQLGYDDRNNRGDDPNEMGANLIFVHIGTGFVVEDMKLGVSHSCAKSVDRAMKCFGRNTESQLGFDGVTTTGDALPFLVFGAEFNLSKIAAGRYYTCALSTDAALKCFGDNTYGQCGTGTSATTISGPPSEINAIDLGTDFTAVDVQTSYYHVCVKSQQGTAKCFGLNNAGQLGYGDTTDRGKTPASMGAGLAILNLGSVFTAAAIATGAYHSCALSTTKTVKCWGCGGAYNYGQCGTPYSTETGDDLPVLVFGADFVPVQLALGTHHTCILAENAVLICFGRNNYGQLGLGHTTDVGTPSTLTGIDLGTGFVPRRVAAGTSHNCAVSTTDAIKCFGYNYYGELGLGHANNVGDGANEMGDNLSFVDVDRPWPTPAPTTAAPTTEEPTTAAPTTTAPTTAAPTSVAPTTAEPTTAAPTTPAPTTATPTTATPTSSAPTITAPTTAAPTTTAPSTVTPTIAASTTTPPTTVATLPAARYNVTIASDELQCEEIEDVIVPAVYDAAPVPIIINVTTGCDGDETIPIQLLVAVPAGASFDNKTAITNIFIQVIYEVYEVTDVVIIVNRIIPPQDTDSEVPPLLSTEWWIVIVFCLLIVVCVGVWLVIKKSVSRNAIKYSPVVTNITNITNYSDNRGAQIGMAGTAAVDAQKNKKKQDKNTGADADASEEEKVDDSSVATAADAIAVKNALVLSVGVSEYNTKDNLPGVISDVENHRHLWKNVYNYRVIPDKDDCDAEKWFDKKYWTYDDIEEFILEKRDEMFDSDDNLLYDALIITLNGHGAASGILPSDYDANDKDNKFPVNYSLLQIFVDGNWNAQVSTIPRIFIIDACRGPSDNAAARPDEAPQARGNPGTVHKDALTCLLYGNSPGYKVREDAAKGGNFSQCLISELKRTNNASTSQPLSIISSRASKALKRKSDKEQTCWLEGDPQCNNVVFVRKK